MKMNPHLLKSAAAIAAIALTVAVPAHAGAVAGATEPTQILNNVQLVLQEANQVQMVANQLNSLAKMPVTNWGQASSDLAALTQAVSVGQGISYTMSNVASAFQQQYPGYQAPQNFGQSYQQWGQNSLSSISAALQAAGLQSSQFSTERAALSAIQMLANNPLGQTQAIQAGTEIASAQVDQLQKLRQLMMAQIQAQGAYMANQTQTQQAGMAMQQQHFTPYTPTAPTFSSQGGSN